MSELLAPPLVRDGRCRAIDALSERLQDLDLSPILVYLIDRAPAVLLPHLAEQFNVVGPLWTYLQDDAARRRAIRGAIAWHRAKGTPWSVETALSWAGCAARVEDDTSSARRWAEYQLELDAPVAGARLRTVLELARFAAPARAHLARLYSGYDGRVLHASRGDRWSDMAFLSDDSGVWFDGVKLSFGRARSARAARSQTSAEIARVQRHGLHAAHAVYPDVVRYGTARFGDAPVPNHPVLRFRLTGTATSHGLRHPDILAGTLSPQRWTGGWDARSWGRWWPIKPHRRVARAAFVLSDAGRLGEPNTRFGGEAEIVRQRFFWSDPQSRLSDFDFGRSRAPIEQVWAVTRSLAATAHGDVALAHHTMTS